MQNNNSINHWIRQRLFQCKDCENNVLVEVHTGGGSSKEDNYGITYFPLRTTISLKSLNSAGSGFTKAQIVLQYDLLSKLIMLSSTFTKTITKMKDCFQSSSPSNYYQIVSYERNGNKKSLIMGLVAGSFNFVIKIIDPVVSSQPLTAILTFDDYRSMNSLFKQIVDNYTILSTNNIIALSNYEVIDEVKKLHASYNQSSVIIENRMNDLQSKLSVVATKISGNSEPYLLVSDNINTDMSEVVDKKHSLYAYASQFNEEFESSNGFDDIKIDTPEKESKKEVNKSNLNECKYLLASKYLQMNLDNFKLQASAFLSNEKFDIISDIFKVCMIPEHEIQMLKSSPGYDEVLYLVNNVMRVTVKKSIELGDPQILLKNIPLIKFSCKIDRSDMVSIYGLSKELFISMIMIIHFMSEIYKLDNNNQLEDFKFNYSILMFIVKMISNLFFFSCDSLDLDELNRDCVELMNMGFIKELSNKFEYISGNKYKWNMNIESFDKFSSYCMSNASKVDPYRIKSCGMFDEIYDQFPEISRVHSKKSDVVVPSLNSEQSTPHKGDGVKSEDLNQNLEVPNVDCGTEDDGSLCWDDDTHDVEAPVNESKNNEESNDVKTELELYLSVINSSELNVDKNSIDIISSTASSYDDLTNILLNDNLDDMCFYTKRVMDMYPNIRSKMDIIEKINNFEEDINITKTRIFGESDTNSPSNSDNTYDENMMDGLF